MTGFRRKFEFAVFCTLLIYMVTGFIASLPIKGLYSLNSQVRSLQFKVRLMTGFWFITGFSTDKLVELELHSDVWAETKEGRRLIHSSRENAGENLVLKKIPSHLVTDAYFYLFLLRGHFISYKDKAIFSRFVELNSQSHLGLGKKNARAYIPKNFVGEFNTNVLTFFCNQAIINNLSLQKTLVEFDYRYRFKNEKQHNTEYFEVRCDP